MWNAPGTRIRGRYSKDCEDARGLTARCVQRAGDPERGRPTLAEVARWPWLTQPVACLPLFEYALQTDRRGVVQLSASDAQHVDHAAQAADEPARHDDGASDQQLRLCV